MNTRGAQIDRRYREEPHGPRERHDGDHICVLGSSTEAPPTTGECLMTSESASKVDGRAQKGAKKSWNILVFATHRNRNLEGQTA